MRGIVSDKKDPGRCLDDSPTWEYIKSIIKKNIRYLSHIDFYAHNDMDMMEIGNGNLTIQEERTHFAAWAFMKSPILLGTDVCGPAFLACRIAE